VNLSLVFVGDVMLGRYVNRMLEYVAPAYPWGDTLARIRDADWRALNLECAISDRGVPWGATPKRFHFRSDAKNVAVLKAAAIDAVSLANNHILDFEYEAMFDTINVLDRAGIGHAGAGHDRAQAFAPAIREVKGARIGLLAFTDNEPGWEAQPNRPGIAYLPVDPEDPSARTLIEAIRLARPRVEFLVVAAHWGPNWGYHPPSEHVRFAHRLIDEGADIVFGHSSHVVRGVEIYRGRPIMYSTGNFVDDYAVDEIERNDQSCIFRIETEGANARRLLMHPILISECQARIATGGVAREIADKMRELCAHMGTKTAWDAGAGALEIHFG
jgi:poly-gamma-glutamate capsule biosynthesis protein CapA/YwtB (metallophosphatase superfamily)